MSRQTHILNLLFLLGVQLSFGQAINFYQIHEGAFQDKELIFAYWELDGDEIMDDSSSSCNYESAEITMEDHRAQVIELVNNYWIYTPRQTMPYKKAISLIAGNPDKYLLAMYGIGPFQVESQQFEDPLIPGEFRIMSLPKQAFLAKKMFGTKVLRMYSAPTPSEQDFVFSLLTAQFIIRGVQEERIIRESAWTQAPEAAGSRLGSKILLISSSAMGELNNTELKSLYPFEFKIVSDERIRRAIMERDTRHLVLYIRKPTEELTYQPTKMIYDPTDGAILAYSFPLVGKKYAGTGEKLIAQDLKRFKKNWIAN